MLKQNVSKNKHFLFPETHTHSCLSGVGGWGEGGGKKCYNNIITYLPILDQCFLDIETSQLILTVNPLTGFSMMGTLALNWSKKIFLQKRNDVTDLLVFFHKFCAIIPFLQGLLSNRLCKTYRFSALGNKYA